MKVLLFGANGQVGSACSQQLSSAGFEVVALTRQDADFSEPNTVAEVIVREAPDFVVNACAYTAVDKAESEPQLAELVNATSVAAMAKTCQELGIPTLHLSTDYVFDGTASAPYTECDTVSPMGVYGATKLAGEQALMEANPQHLILRTSWVFGVEGNNFVKTMLRLGESRPELGVVSDQVGCPTYAGDIAKVVVHCVAQFEQDKPLTWGLYHCSNSDVCSWYDFASHIFSSAVQLGLLPKSPKVNPISTAEYPTPAARPAYSVLDCSKLNECLPSPLRSWKKGLDEMLQAL